MRIDSTLCETSWPAGVKLPVVLTFEHQSGEGAPSRPGDRPNANAFGQMEYGARRGIWNILELLDRFGVKSTFFVSGLTAEKFPETVRAAASAGHEIAGMGYSFDRVRTASPDKERMVIRRSSRVLADTCGAAIKGWRCPDYRVSPQTFDLLAEEGFEWDSSMLNDDRPYQIFKDGRPTIMEVPFTTSTADKAYIGFPYPMRGGPSGLAQVWNNEFDFLHEEAGRLPRYMILSLQTWATGRPAPLRTFRQFIERIAGHNDVCFARCGDIARWAAPATI